MFQLVSMTSDRRRLSISIGIVATVVVGALFRAAWPRGRRKKLQQELRKKGIVGQHNFTRGDVAYAVYSSVFESDTVRNIVLCSAILTAGASQLGLLPRMTVASANRYIRAGSTFIVTFCAFNYLVFVVERPVVMYKRTVWNVSIMERSAINRRMFRPIFWMANRHLMTICGSILNDLSWLFLRPVQYVREEIAAFDGNVLNLDWFVLQADPNRRMGDGLIRDASLASFASFASFRFTRDANSVDAPNNGSSNLGTMHEEPGSDLGSSPSPLRRLDTFEKVHDVLPPDTPVVLILHGIGGSRNDAYVKRFAAQCGSFGWRPVAFSYWRLDWNEWRDMDVVVRSIARRYPMAPLFAVGFSAGAYVLGNYLAAVGRDTPLVAALTCAGCFDFVRTYEYCDKQQSSIYTNVLDRGMKKCIKRHIDHDKVLFKGVAGQKKGKSPELDHPSDSDEPGLSSSHRDADGVLAQVYEKLLRDIRRANILYDRHLALLPQFTGCPEDRRFGRPPTGSFIRGLSGMSTAREHAARESAKVAEDVPRYRSEAAIRSTDRRDEDWWSAFDDQYNCTYPLPSTALHTFSPVRLRMDRIEVSTLMIHARDDPIVSHDDTVDWRAVHKNHNIITVRTDRGGHLAWFEGLYPAGPSWADKTMCDFIHAVLGMRAQTQFFVDVARRAIREDERKKRPRKILQPTVSSFDPNSQSMEEPLPLTPAPSEEDIPTTHSFLQELDRPMKEAGTDSMSEIPPGRMARFCSIPQLEMPVHVNPDTAKENPIESIRKFGKRSLSKSSALRGLVPLSLDPEQFQEYLGDQPPAMRISELDLPGFLASAMGANPASSFPLRSRDSASYGDDAPWF